MTDTKRHPLRAGLLLGLIHGVLFGLAFPPFGWWFLALLAPIPLILAAVRADRPARAALGAALGTVPMWAYHHQFTWAMTEAAFVPLSLYLALYPGLFVWMLARVHRRSPRLPLYLAAPVLWTGLEVLRGEVVWDGYAQYLIAHPLIDRMIAWAAPVVGIYGVGLLVNAVVTASIPHRLLQPEGLIYSSRGSSESSSVTPGNLSPQTSSAPRRGAPQPRTIAPVRRILYATACLTALFAFLFPRGTSPTVAHAPALRITAIQTNVSQDNRTSQTIDQRLEDFRDFCNLTREAAEQAPKPSLIVWPETMFPGYALNPSAVAAERAASLAYPGNIPTTVFYDAILELQKEIGIPMLVGATAAEGLRIDVAPDGKVNIKQDALYNSAFMVRNGVVEETRYDKMQLMPFGEVMPYISNWDWLERQLLALGGRGLTFDLEAGKNPTVLEIQSDPVAAATGPPKTVRIATPICFESTYSRHMRRLAQNNGERRADLFINLSNDGWFAWYDAGRDNLVLQCRWRALELGTPMLRAVNTGLSAAIDADGRVISSLPARQPGVLIADFDVQPRRMTIYARFGNGVGWTCFAGMAILACGAVWNRKSEEK